MSRQLISVYNETEDPFCEFASNKYNGKTTFYSYIYVESANPIYVSSREQLHRIIATLNRLDVVWKQEEEKLYESGNSIV